MPTKKNIGKIIKRSATGLSDKKNPYKTKLTYSYDRNLVGEYKPTKLDREKKNNNRLVSIDGKYYTVITKDNKILHFVGKRNFNKWAKNNNYVTDF
jgi:negative regulator of sigma E activity